VGNNVTTISFPGLQAISGSLVASSCDQLSKISAPWLSSIGTNLTLSNLPALTSLDFPALSTVYVALNWDTLPVIEAPKLNASERIFTYNIIISNTSLTNLSFLNFADFPGQTHEKHTVKITDNPSMENIDLTGMGVSENLLEVANNGPNANLSLPNLTSTFDVTLGDLLSVSLPSLVQVFGSFILRNNKFASITIPMLTTLGGACIEVSAACTNSFNVTNNMFEQITLPGLELLSVTTDISDNPVLHTIDLPTVSDIGNITMTGVMNKYDSFTL
jgi:hypothetical protein